MTTRATADALLDLAARCEAATGPDRELDFAILCVKDNRAFRTGPLPGDPRYTASLDAAMTLVPEGAGVRLERYWLRDGPVWSAALYQGIERKHDAFSEDQPTPALALCAAALRARTTQGRDKGDG